MHRFLTATGSTATAVLAVLTATGCSDAPANDPAIDPATTEVQTAAVDPAGAIISAAAGSDPALAAELEAIRAATEKYRDVHAALADGYVRDPMDMCVTPEMEGVPRQLGGMGVHYFRPDLLGITGTNPRVDGVGTHTDFRQPGVLVYEPQADGSLELVAVENLVFRDAWTAAGRDGPPEFMGNQYYTMIDNPGTPADEAHGFAPHYELHMWLYRENPSGLFAQFNPNTSCRDHDGATDAHGERQ